MAGNVAANIVAATLDGLSFLLLIPFLDELFQSKQPIPDLGFLGKILHSVIGQYIAGRSKMDSLSLIIVAIGVIVVVKNAFVWIAGQLGASLQEYVTRDLRDAVFTHVQRLPLSYFHRTKAGQIITRIVSDTDQTKALITELVTRSIQNLAKIVVTIVILIRMSPRLAALSLIAAPLLTAALQPILRRLRKGHRRLRNDYGEMTSILQEVISGVRLVKSFGGERYEDGRFVDASHRYSHGMVRMNRVAVLSQPLTEIIGTSIAMLILWVGAREVLTKTGGMDAAALIVFMTYVMTLLPPLKQISQAPTTAQQALAAAERLFEVLDRPTEPDTDRGTRSIASFADAIVFDDVQFAYEDAPVLEGIGFTARRGQVVALVGPSGAGKSTLVDLIPRFYEPTAGRILFDGVDAREITLSSLRALTGIVSQDTVLFNDTVRNNIAYGAVEPLQRRGDRARGQSGQRARLHHGASQRVRHRVGRTRHAPVRRTAATAGDRARAARRSADSHLRRSHLGARHGVRAAGAGGDRPLAGRAHRVRHRTPVVDHRARRRHSRARPWADRRARHPRRALGRARRVLPAARAAVPRRTGRSR